MSTITLKKGIFHLSIPQKSMVLVEASPGLGASILIISHLSQEIMKNNKVFFVTAIKSYNQIKKEFSIFGVSEDALKRSLFLATTLREDFPNLSIINMSELFTISDVVKQFLMNSSAGYIDVITPLLVLEKTSNVFSLVKEIADEIHGSLGYVFITIDPSVAERKVLSLIESLADIIIEMREESKGFHIIRGLRVKKFTGGLPTVFYEYSITERGLVVGDPLE
ncbi:MAG: RAD55 family ATPase [Candidatus Asgardarchaeia archaeon]